MSNLVLSCVFLTLASVSLADPHRPGKYLDHDRTVVNCAKYKREANQHSCVLSTFNTEGPYFLPDDLQRSDITDGQVGIPLNLKINLVNANDCTPLENMYIHIWHANATGSYSGVDNIGQNGGGFPGGPWGPDGLLPPPPGMDITGPGDNGMGGGRPTPATSDRFLRGYQITDSSGQVNFDTIVPGWYTGRCLHIHIEVYHKNSTQTNDITYVGQIFFNRELPYELKLIEPYSANNQQLIINDDDWIYNNHGNETLINLLPTTSSSITLSYSSSVTFGINPDAKISNQIND